MKPVRALTIGQLARRVGLARGTLLHYESIGLLHAAARSEAGYRWYGPEALERLHLVRHYRDAGLSLEAIVQLLTKPETGASALLERRLHALGTEIDHLREQQRRLARLLALDGLRAPAGGKSAWVALLREAGFSEADMGQWHADFEAADAAGHAAFLRSLGLSAAELASIRRAARAQLSV